MKILYMITKSNYGGAQRYLFDLAVHLPKKEYEVVVALGGTGEKGAETGSLKTKLEAQGIRTIVVEHFLRNISLFSDISAFFELIRIMQKEKPAVLHVMSSKAGGLGALAGRMCRIHTIIFTSHGLAFDEAWRSKTQRILIWFFSWLTFLLSTHIIQLSQDTYTRARAMPFMRKKISLIYNGIESPLFVPKAKAREILLTHLPKGTKYLWEGEEAKNGKNAQENSQRNLVPLSEPWIGCIAELHPNKNISLLIEALALLHKKNIPVHLWVMGEGEERERLAKKVEQENLSAFVHLVGYVQGASSLLPAFDVFTLPSHKEGLPYVLLEAGHAGLPCVVSDIAGNTDIVEDAISGITLPLVPEVFAEAFAKLLSNSVYAKSLGHALHKKIQRAFSIECMLEKTTRLYIKA